MTHLTSSGFQFAYDNTSISRFKDCPRKYKLTILDGWAPKGLAPPLVFGLAIHDLLEAWELDTDAHESKLLKFVKHLFLNVKPTYPEDMKGRTFHHLLRTFIWYVDEYRDNPVKTYMLGETPAVELSFRLEFPATYQSAPNGVLYCGHIDQVVTYMGAPYILEHKHTTWALNDAYLARYNPNGQISGYIWASKIAFSIPARGAIIDAIQVGENFSRFMRIPEPRTDSQINEWLESTAMWIGLIEQAWQHNNFPLNEESCAKYGGCPFRKVCSSDPSMRKNYLDGYYEQKPWEPLKIRGVQE